MSPVPSKLFTGSCQVSISVWWISSLFLYSSFLNFHDDVMTWKCFPHYWPFVRGMQWFHQSPMDSPHKVLVMWKRLSLLFSWDKLFKQQSSCWWCEMLLAWHTLNCKICHDANFVVDGDTNSCHDGNLLWHQEWQSWHHDQSWLFCCLHGMHWITR